MKIVHCIGALGVLLLLASCSGGLYERSTITQRGQHGEQRLEFLTIAQTKGSRSESIQIGYHENSATFFLAGDTTGYEELNEDTITMDVDGSIGVFSDDKRVSSGAIRISESVMIAMHDNDVETILNGSNISVEFVNRYQVSEIGIEAMKSFILEKR